jgi:hypothetical protein
VAESHELGETDVEQPTNVGDVEFTDSADRALPRWHRTRDHGYHYQRQHLTHHNVRLEYWSLVVTPNA